MNVCMCVCLSVRRVCMCVHSVCVCVCAVDVPAVIGACGVKCKHTCGRESRESCLRGVGQSAECVLLPVLS